MDFIVGLPRSRRGNDTIWVIVDRLTKSAHFVPMVATASMDTLANLCMDCIIRYHSVPVSIVSDRILDSPLDFGKVSNKPQEPS